MNTMLGLDPAQVDTSAMFALGTRGSDDGVNEYIYLEADEAIAVSGVVIIHADFGSENLDATSGAAATGTGKKLAVAPAAGVASGSFYWGCVCSNAFTTKGIDSCAAFVELYATSTPGALDDVFDGDVCARGIVFNVTLSGVTVQSAMINYPVVVNSIDS